MNGGLSDVAEIVTELTEEVRKSRQSQDELGAVVLQELRDRQSHNWRTAAKLLGCICIIQTGALIAQGLDQSERELRAKQMIRVDQWLTNMFGTLKTYDRRLDKQDRWNELNEEAMKRLLELKRK